MSGRPGGGEGGGGMIEHPQDERATVLLAFAQRFACELRDDLHTAHCALTFLDRPDREALACVLAAMVPIDKPILPWWQYRPDTPDAVADRRRVLAEALAPRRRPA